MCISCLFISICLFFLQTYSFFRTQTIIHHQYRGDNFAIHLHISVVFIEILMRTTHKFQWLFEFDWYSWRINLHKTVIIFSFTSNQFAVVLFLPNRSNLCNSLSLSSPLSFTINSFFSELISSNWFYCTAEKWLKSTAYTHNLYFTTFNVSDTFLTHNE